MPLRVGAGDPARRDYAVALLRRATEAWEHRPVQARGMRPVPLTILGLTVAMEIAAVALSVGLEPAYDTLLYALYSPVMAATGR